MDLLTAILTCSVYTSDDSLVRAIAESNSHGNPFAVLDAAASGTDEPSAEPRTLEAAMARFEEVRSKGGKPLLGWMQLPPSWVTMFEREPREAFDPCINISIGTAMLSAFHYECSVESSPARERRNRRRRPPRSPVHHDVDRRACVVRKYGEALGMMEFAPVTTLELRYQAPGGGEVPTNAPLFATDPSAQWGANRVLFAAFGEDRVSAPPRVSTTAAGRSP